MKKVIPLILAIAMIFSCGLVTALANPPRKITLGAFTYDLDHSNSTAIVTGYRPLDGSGGTAAQSVHVSIPSNIAVGGAEYKVVAIADDVFMDQGDILSVIIPASMIEVGNGAFRDCLNLKSVTFAPNSALKGIGKDAFNNCKNLENINLPSCVQYLGDRAFENCEGLKAIQIPTSLKRIEARTFTGCTSLTSMEIPRNIEAIEPFAFSQCKKLASVHVQQNSSLRKISDLAFAECHALECILIPNSVKELGDGVFANCLNLESVTLFARNVDLGENVFDLLDLDSPIFNPQVMPNPNLSTIFYAGTRGEWDAIVKNSGENVTLRPDNKSLTVICMDDYEAPASTSAPQPPAPPTPPAPAPTPAPVSVSVYVSSAQTTTPAQTPDPAQTPAQAPAVTQAQMTAEAKAKAQADAKAKAKAEAEAKAKAQAEAKAKAQAKAKADAEARAKARAEAQARAQAQAQARAKAQAEAQARKQAETEARLKAQKEAQVKAKAEAEAKAKAQKEAQEKAQLRLNLQKEAKASTTVSSSTSSSRLAQNEFSFWSEVASRISQAPGNTTVEVNASGYDNLSAHVMDVLRQHPTVTLTLHWDDTAGHHTVTFPAGQALAPEAGRVSYPLSELEQSHSRAPRASSTSTLTTVKNPSTGGPQVTATAHLPATSTVSAISVLVLAGIYIFRKTKNRKTH